MTPEQKEQLAALAKAATPGPWEDYISSDGFAKIVAPNDGGFVFSQFVLGIDAKYTAAASPTAVLELLEENKQLEAERDDAYRALKTAEDLQDAWCEDNDAQADWWVSHYDAVMKARAFVEGERK